MQDVWYAHGGGNNDNNDDASTTDEKQQRRQQQNIQYAFRGLSVSIPRGRVTLLVGGVGTGKSTLLDLVLGHRRPTRGAVLYDGVPLDELERRGDTPRALYVPQTPMLFNRTVYENIAYGLCPGTCSKARVARRMREFERATGLPLCSGFVDVLPRGLDTPVGLHGSRLSGGQRQLVWLSKLLFLDDVELVVLDEPTASVDDRARRTVRGLVRHATQGRDGAPRTVLMVTHDRKLLDLADRVVRLERRRERGEGGDEEQEQEREREREHVVASIVFSS